MKILITGDLASSKEFLEKNSIQVVEFDDDAYIINTPESVKIRKNAVSKEDLPKSTNYQLLSEYLLTQDNSLKDLITNKGCIIASGDLEVTNAKLALPYDYVARGGFRIYDQMPMTVLDFSACGQIDVQEYEYYLEKMLINSTQISLEPKAKKK